VEVKNPLYSLPLVAFGPNNKGRAICISRKACSALPSLCLDTWVVRIFPEEKAARQLPSNAKRAVDISTMYTPSRPAICTHWPAFAPQRTSHPSERHPSSRAYHQYQARPTQGDEGESVMSEPKRETERTSPGSAIQVVVSSCKQQGRKARSRGGVQSSSSSAPGPCPPTPLLAAERFAGTQSSKP